MKRSVRSVVGALGASALISFLVLTSAGILNGQTQKNTSTPVSDIKIRQKMTMAGNDRGTETIMYVKGSRMRNDMAVTGMSMITVRQCDLNRTLTINDKSRTYMITPDGADGAASDGGSPGANVQQTTTRKGGVVTITNTITDTGERKEMFGFTARHIKTSMIKEASPDACDKGNNKIETDGWYIDFDFDFYCPMDRKKIETPGLSSRPDCQDEIRSKSVGKGKLGFPLLTTTTIYSPDGKPTSTITNEVLELSRGPLDVALFDVPAGYTLAKNYQELYGMGGGVSSASAGSSTRTPSAEMINSVASAVTTPAGFVAANSPKREGVSRIGIIMPSAQMTTGESVPAAAGLRNTFASYLNSPNIELVALNARLPSQALEEAKQSNCDYVLYASLTQKKGGGGMFGKALGNIARSTVGHLPGGSNAGEAAARSATVSGVYTAADISSSIKAKDELTLDYKLESTTAARPGVASTAKAKAKSDGEDVFTPLVEKAAQAVVDVVAKK